jgi:MarR family transcriptional regulator, organic hydroperoxide resistance regulator
MDQTRADGLGTQLRRLLELLDGDLEAIYAQDGLDYRARFTPVMKALADGEALTIKQIAARSSVSHSAASQTVSRMLSAGLLMQSVGEDARERFMDLSPQGVELLPGLRLRWAAAERAAERLESDIGLPLGRAVAAAITALEDRPFRTRVIDEGQQTSTEKPG